jgi:hypothetical protein
MTYTWPTHTHTYVRSYPCHRPLHHSWTISCLPFFICLMCVYMYTCTHILALTSLSMSLYTHTCAHFLIIVLSAILQPHHVCLSSSGAAQHVYMLLCRSYVRIIQTVSCVFPNMIYLHLFTAAHLAYMVLCRTHLRIFLNRYPDLFTGVQHACTHTHTHRSKLMSLGVIYTRTHIVRTARVPRDAGKRHGSPTSAPGWRKLQLGVVVKAVIVRVS